MEISKTTSPNDWTYFAKGAANILFKYNGNNDYLRHKLLRLRLLKQDEEYISTCELYDFIELECKHLFPKQIIDIQLVVLTSDFVNRLDSKGHKLMLKERYGLLLPNILDGNYTKINLSKNCQLYYDQLSPESSINSVIFEIKPKWLYDNKVSNYCRTCSLNQFKGLKRHFCPLDLLYQDTINQGLLDLFDPIPAEIIEKIEIVDRIPLFKLFEIYLTNSENNVFQKLRQYQKINNKNDLIENLTSFKDVSTNLSLVMTLRDVGLFIKFEKYDKSNDNHNSHNNINNLIEVDSFGKFLITCNIYDLDLKSKMKYKHWLKVENDLKDIYNSTNPDWRFCIKHRSDGEINDYETVTNNL